MSDSKTLQLLGKIRRRIVGGGAGSTATGNFVGELDLTGATTYAVQQFGFIRTGSNAGAYICIAANNATGAAIPTNPDTGNQYWLAWPGSFPLGNWM